MQCCVKLFDLGMVRYTILLNIECSSNKWMNIVRTLLQYLIVKFLQNWMSVVYFVGPIYLLFQSEKLVQNHSVCHLNISVSIPYDVTSIREHLTKD